MKSSVACRGNAGANSKWAGSKRRAELPEIFRPPETGKHMNPLTKWNPFRKSNAGEEWGAMARWSPAREMEDLESRMEWLVRNWPAWPETKEPLAVVDWAPQVDITEDDRNTL